MSTTDVLDSVQHAVDVQGRQMAVQRDLARLV